MADSEAASPRSQQGILYDVWVHQDVSVFEEKPAARAVPLSPQRGTAWSNVGTGAGPLLPQNVLEHLHTLPPFAIDVTPLGDKVVLLLHNKLALRTAENGFATVIAENTLPTVDVHPQIQRLAWSPDGGAVAVLNSSGELHVFDSEDLELLGSLDLKQACSEDFCVGSAGFFLRKVVSRGAKVYEAVAATFSGQIHRIILPLDSDDLIQPLSTYYRIREGPEKEISVLKLTGLHTRCVALTYHADSNVMAVAGLPETSAPATSLENASISLWNLKDEQPFYESIYPEKAKSTTSLPSPQPITEATAVHKRHSFDSDATLFKMAFNRRGDILASLDIQGQLQIYRNNLRIKSFTSEQIYRLSKGDSIIDISHEDRIVRGFSWWDDVSLVLARKNGDVLIFGPVVATNGLAAPSNLLGAAPEKFSKELVLADASPSGRFFLFDAEESIARVPKTRRLMDEDVPGASSSNDESGDTSMEEDSALAEATRPPSSQAQSGWRRVFSTIFRYNIGKKKEQQIEEPLSAATGKGSGSSSDSTNVSGSPLGPKFVSRRRVQYRLMSLSSTTPEDLFRAKLEAQEYGYALKLAQHYGLPTDPVWQRRFCLDPVNRNSIVDFLPKVQDIRWILRECKQRIASTEAAQRALLDYGLQITVPKEFLDSQKPKSPRSMLLKEKQPESDSGSEADHDDEDTEYQGATPPMAAPDLATHFAALPIDSFTRLDIELLTYRLVFLRLLDRLSTFSAVCRTTGRSYDAHSWLKFRSSHLVSTAISYALEEHCSAIDILFTYHSGQTLPYRLHILECIPETCDPEKIFQLMPAIEPGETHESDWDRRHWRKQVDWVEDPEVLQNLLNAVSRKTTDIDGLSVEDLRDLSGALQLCAAVFPEQGAVHNKFSKGELHCQDPNDENCPRSPDIYAPLSEQVADLPRQQLPRLDHIVSLPAFPMDYQTISKWVSHRSRTIECRTGQTDYALRLLDLASKNGITGTQEIRHTLSTLRTLVYECSKVHLTLHEYESLTALDRFTFLLQPLPEFDDPEGPNKIIELMHTRAMFIIEEDRRLWRQGRYTSSEGSVLASWLVQQAKVGRMDMLHAVLSNSFPKEDQVQLYPPIIPTEEAICAIGLEACYALPSSSPGDIEYIFDRIFEHIPVVEPDTDRMAELQDRAAAFEGHLGAMEILCKYDCCKPLGTFLNEWSEEVGGVEQIRQLFTRIAQQGVRAKPPWSPERWGRFLKDMNAIREMAFPKVISREFVYAQFCKALLKSAHWVLAREYLENAVGPEQLIVSTAVEYFNSCNNPFDESMQRALECLQVVQLPLGGPSSTEDPSQSHSDSPLISARTGHGVSTSTSAAQTTTTAAQQQNTPAQTVLRKTPEIRAEINLIEGVRKLYKLGLEILPLQIRTAKSRLQLLRTLFSNKSSASKFSTSSIFSSKTLEEIISAAELIGLSKREDKFEIRLMAAEVAFEEMHDHPSAARLCFELIELGSQNCWSLCLKLASSEEGGVSSPPHPQYESIPLHDRMRLAAFAALHCPKRDTESVVALWRSLESRYSCEQLGLELDPVAAPTGSLSVSTEDDLFTSTHQQVLHGCMRKLIEMDSSDLFQRGVQIAQSQVKLALPDDLNLLNHDFYGFSSSSESIYTKFAVEEARSSSNVIDSCKAEIFRLSQLTRSASSSRSDALKHLALTSIKSDDASLFISALFSFESAESVRVFLDDLIANHSSSTKDSERLTRLAAYFFALDLLSFEEVISGSKLDKPHLKSIEEVLEYCTNKLEADLKQQRLSPAATQVWDLQRQLQMRLGDFNRVKELQSLNMNVDVTKFGMDTTYKREVILQLARSTKPSDLQQAVELARKYRTPDIHSVLVEHLCSVFSSQHEEAESDPKSYLQEFEAAILERPDSLAVRLESVFSHIPPSNFSKFAYWFELKRDSALSTRAQRFASPEECSADAQLCETNMKLLNKLIKIRPAPQLDYRRLCTSTESALIEIGRVVNENNVFGLAKVSSDLSVILKAHDVSSSGLTPSAVFAALICRLLTVDFDNSPEQVLENAKSVVGRFLPRLDSSDLSELIRVTIIGSQQAIDTPLETRLTLAQSVSELVSSPEFQKRQQNAEASDLTAEFLTAAERHLRFIKQLWDWLRSHSDAVVNDFNRRSYFEKFDVAFRDGAAINAALKQMIANGIDLGVVGYFAVQFKHEEAQHWKSGRKSILELQSLYRTVIDDIVTAIELCPTAIAPDADSEDSTSELLRDRVLPYPPSSAPAALLMLEALLSALELAKSPTTFDETPEAVDRIKILVLDKLRLNTIESVTSTSSTGALPSRDTRIALLRIMLAHRELYASGKPSRVAQHRADAQVLESLTSSQIINKLLSAGEDTAALSPELGHESQSRQFKTDFDASSSSNTPESKISTFTKLLEEAGNAETFEQIGRLLRVWSKHHIENMTILKETTSASNRTSQSRRLQLDTSDSSSQNLLQLNPFSPCWRQLFCRLAEKGQFDLLWNIRLGFPEAPEEWQRYLAEADELAVFHHLKAVSAPRFQVVKFGLCSSSYEILDLARLELEEVLKIPTIAVAAGLTSHLAALGSFFKSWRLSDESTHALVFGYDYDFWFLAMLIRKNLVSKLAESHSTVSRKLLQLVSQLLLYRDQSMRSRAKLQVILKNKETMPQPQVDSELARVFEALAESDASLSFENVVSQLTLQCHFIIAGSLAMTHRNIPAELHSVELALQLLPQYLSDRVQRIQDTSEKSSDNRSGHDVSQIVFDSPESAVVRLPVTCTWESCRSACREALQVFSESMEV